MTLLKKQIESYDFAPSGYFTFSKEGKIIELNLFGSQMLGKERSLLINSSFDSFVSVDSKITFNLFLENIFRSKVKESCEVTLSENDNLPILVYLTGIASKNCEQCFVTVVDINDRTQDKVNLNCFGSSLSTTF